jgi:hypothetical protein
MMDYKFLQEGYGLKEGARESFSDITARKRQLAWWINREEELNKWKEIIRKSVDLPKNYFVFIIGTYGRGKTLSLFKVIEESELHKKIYPIYLNFKGEEKSKPGLDFIFRIFKVIDFDNLVKGKTAEDVNIAIKNIPEGFEEAKTILKKIYFGVSGITLESFVSTDSKMIKSKEKANISKLALFFLRGQIRPTSSQLTQLGVIRRIEDIDVAKEYLAAVLCFIKNLGYKTLLLAIDEFESLFSLVPPSQHSIYTALLRGLYDFPTGIAVKSENVANMAFFVAISESGWSSLKEMEKREISTGGPTVPFLDRIDATTTLGTFDKNQTRELIIKRLKYNRIEGKFEENPLIPFTEDFVEYIYELTRGEPRFTIVRCGQVLDAGLADRTPLLNKEFAKSALEERGF